MTNLLSQIGTLMIINVIATDPSGNERAVYPTLKFNLKLLCGSTGSDDELGGCNDHVSASPR